jgi:rubredoxin
MYVYETKEGDTYIMKIAKCKRCLGTEFVEVEKKWICKNCGVEFTDEGIR